MRRFVGAAWAALRGQRSTARENHMKGNTMATQLVQAPHGSPAWFHKMIERGHAGPFMEVVNLGPALAKEMLGSNPDNRSIRKTKLDQYAADMRAGNWSLNGEPLIVSKDGNLNDGQHRCLACMDANTTAPVVIMFGIERDTRLTVDQGSARSAGDFLSMEGMPYGPMMAAIARLAIAFERNGGSGLADSNRVTSAEIRQRVSADNALGEAAKFGTTNGHYTRQFCAGSIVSFSFYTLAKIDEAAARVFLERVCRGDGLSMRDPAHTVREKLRADPGISRDRKLAMIFKAWNFHRRGMKVAVNSLNSTLPFPALV